MSKVLAYVTYWDRLLANGETVHFERIHADATCARVYGSMGTGMTIGGVVYAIKMGQADLCECAR
jgi:hypothetical protein